MNKILFKNANLLYNGKFTQSDFVVSDGKFLTIAPSINSDASQEVVDLKGQTVIQGLLDIHTHGGLGVDFNLCTKETIGKVADYFQSVGVTSLFPTLLTDSDEVLVAQLSLIASEMENYPLIKGIHLEGPFLNPQYKGAMPEHLLQKPSIERFKKYQAAAKGNIKYVTLSPELDGAIELIKYLEETGITATMGHTSATYAEAENAFKCGAKGATHLFNAMRPIHHHEMGIAGAALSNDNIFCEVISDGFHLNPHTVKFIIRNKGLDKTVLISDSLMAAGLPNGDYFLGVNEITVVDGDARLKIGGARAGSTLGAINAVTNCEKFAGISFASSIKLMSENPAKLTKIDNIVGKIAEGLNADFLVLTAAKEVSETFILGKKVYKKI